MIKFNCIFKVFILIIILISGANSSSYSQNSITANDVIQSIKENVTCDWAEETVDTFKAGDPSSNVTGIATTFIATMDVLKKAVEENCNLIITHEPTFYNHLDQTDHLKDDPVYEAKIKYINDNNLIIFRFHDHVHQTTPDGILMGMIDRLGWEEHRIEGEDYVFDFPDMFAGELAKDLKMTFHKAPIRLIGDPKMSFSRVAFAMGAPGYMAHIKMLQRDDVDVLVGGEVPEWESITYVRDATGAGINKVMILIGHANSEEGGMEYVANWLGEIVKEVPVRFIPSGDPFYTPR